MFRFIKNDISIDGKVYKEQEIYYLTESMRRLVVKKFLYIIFVVVLIYSSINIFFHGTTSIQYEVYITSKNRENIKTLSEDKIPDNITRIKMKIMLGDAKLYLYKNFHLSKEIMVLDSAPIVQYIQENGINICFRYLIYILVCLIFMLFLHD